MPDQLTPAGQSEPAGRPDQLDTVGVVGLGHMGLPMAQRLVAAGYRVLGSDVSASNLEAAASAGVEPAGSPARLAAECDAIVLMLPNSDIVDAVAAQIAESDAAARRCTTVIDMSSSEPLRTRALGDRLDGRGIRLIDAPVSGGVIGAVAGTLTIMVGGPQADFDRLEPMLRELGSRVLHVGDVGSGHAVKALNNLMSAAHLIVASETAVVATRFGIDPAVLLEVVNGSSGRSGSTELKLPRYVLPGTFDSGFSAALMEKDVRIAGALAESLGVETTLSDAAISRWRELNAQLPGDADHTAIIRPLERQAGVEVRSSLG